MADGIDGERVWDVIVVGGGIAGASVAARLAPGRRVLLLEREAQAGMHATGRSAAVFTELYGNPNIRDLTALSRAELAAVSRDGVAAMHRCGTLFVADESQRGSLEKLRQTLPGDDVAAELPVEATVRLCPILRPDYVAAAIHESGSASIDVELLLQHYLAEARSHGAHLTTEVRIDALAHSHDGWRVTTNRGEFNSPVIVNAAGAWADELAALAGAQPVGIQPFRRTAVLIDPPDGVDIAGWPLVLDVEERFYFKPFGVQIMVSPADEEPCDPHDVQPEDLDVAIAVDRLETVTTLQVRRIAGKWAGLRSFAPDRTPVVGFDPDRPGFFWLAGQGGYGIQTAPALARIAADLIDGASGGTHEAALSPQRFKDSGG